MLDEYVLNIYMKEVYHQCPKKITKDVTIEVSQNSSFPERKDFSCINFYYKGEIILRCPYNLDDIFILGTYIDPVKDTESFMKKLKDHIFQDYINGIPVKEDVLHD